MEEFFAEFFAARFFSQSHSYVDGSGRRHFFNVGPGMGDGGPQGYPFSMGGMGFTDGGRSRGGGWRHEDPEEARERRQQEAEEERAKRAERKKRLQEEEASRAQWRERVSMVPHRLNLRDDSDGVRSTPSMS